MRAVRAGLVWRGLGSLFSRSNSPAFRHRCAAVGLLIAWLLAYPVQGRNAFEFVPAFAIPGTVLGVSYILAFNVPPVESDRHSSSSSCVSCFRNLPVGVRAGT